MKNTFITCCTTLLWSVAYGQNYNNAFAIQSANNDRGTRITTDNNGAVLATGYFSGIADFDPGPGTASLTPNGGSTEDVYVAKYDAAFNYLWAVKFGGSGTDFPYGLTTDMSNNVVVGGDVSSNNRDGFVNKYDPNGNLLWTLTLGGTGKDVVYGVATDGANNVYVTGYFSNSVDFDPGAGIYSLTSNGGRDVFLAKYDSSGNFRWAFNAGGTISTAYEEGGQDLAISGANIYLVGNFQGTADFNPDSLVTNALTSNGSLDIFTAKYDTSGAFIWAFNAGSANKHDYCYGVGLDAAENVYITGAFEESVDFDPSASSAVLISGSAIAQDIYVAKYNSAGAYQWAFQVGGTSAVDDRAFDIHVTLAGDFYITGEVWGPADFDPSAASNSINTSNDQIFFARYTSMGALVWVFEVGSTSGNGSADNGYGVHVGANGFLYVTGDFSATADFNPGTGTSSMTASGSSDAFIGSYDPALFVNVPSSVVQNIQVTAYPNPANNEVLIFNRSYDQNDWTLKITDATGNVIFVSEAIGNESIRINTEHMAAGMYFYTVNTGHSASTHKLLISR